MGFSRKNSLNPEDVNGKFQRVKTKVFGIPGRRGVCQTLKKKREW